MVPPARPVLLIQDGHCSHVSIEGIELATAHSIHLLCLLPHTTHILQPLDVGVFKSFKAGQKGEWNINNKGRKIEVQERERTGPFLRHLL